MGITTGPIHRSALRSSTRTNAGLYCCPSFLSTPRAPRGAQGLGAAAGCPGGDGGLDSGLRPHQSGHTEHSPLGPGKAGGGRPLRSGGQSRDQETRLVPRTVTRDPDRTPACGAWPALTSTPSSPSVRPAESRSDVVASRRTQVAPPLTAPLIGRRSPRLWAGLRAGLRPPHTP